MTMTIEGVSKWKSIKTLSFSLVLFMILSILSEQIRTVTSFVAIIENRNNNHCNRYPKIAIQRRQPKRSFGTSSILVVSAIKKTKSEQQKDTDTVMITYDGRGRGRILFGIVFLICIWQFSIPPTFRRAKFCPKPCVIDRTICRNNCVTFQEWTSDIVQYYQNGGGIQWDFSIDPNTLAENERFIQSILGNK